jgi:hypothetical protein
MNMSNLLFHPARVILSLSGIICALIASAYFGSSSAMIPAVLVILRFLVSGRRNLTGIGVVLVLAYVGLLFWQPDRLEIEYSSIGSNFAYASLAFMLLAGLHLWVTVRSTASTIPEDLTGRTR